MHFVNVFEISLLLIISEALALEPNKPNNKPKIDELVFDSSSSWFKHKRRENITVRAAEPHEAKSLNAENTKYLESTVQNIIKIDKLSKENVIQFDSLTKCNNRLRELESELENINSDIEQITRANMKTPRYVTRNVSKNGASSRKIKQKNKVSDVQLPSASPDSPFFHSNVMHDIRKQFVNYLKAELEKNYNTIQNLQTKIKKLEQSRTIKFKQMKAQSNETETNENGCQSLQGTGFAQLIQLDETNPDDYVKEQTVLCENSWLVIQQRENAFETSFNRTWTEYADGFGFTRGDFWLGLKKISSLTSKKSYQLMIELTDWSDQVFTAHYNNFEVGSEQDFFRLSISDKYVGNASRDLIDDMYYGFLSQNGAYFSTYDNNKAFHTTDPAATLNTKNCALKSGGGWWFNNNHCLPVNLNGIYVTGASAPSARGIKWQAIRVHDRNYSLKKSKMKIIANP